MKKKVFLSPAVKAELAERYHKMLNGKKRAPQGAVAALAARYNVNSSTIHTIARTHKANGSEGKESRTNRSEAIDFILKMYEDRVFDRNDSVMLLNAMIK